MIWPLPFQPAPLLARLRAEIVHAVKSLAHEGLAPVDRAAVVGQVDALAPDLPQRAAAVIGRHRLELRRVVAGEKEDRIPPAAGGAALAEVAHVSAAMLVLPGWVRTG